MTYIGQRCRGVGGNVFSTARRLDDRPSMDAIVELVANAWDAWATEVDKFSPERGTDTAFVIKDNGQGKNEVQFQTRGRTLDYNRRRDEGTKSAPPPELAELRPRPAYGRNGKGRHVAFRIDAGYRVNLARRNFGYPHQTAESCRSTINRP